MMVSSSNFRDVGEEDYRDMESCVRLEADRESRFRDIGCVRVQKKHSNGMYALSIFNLAPAQLIVEVKEDKLFALKDAILAVSYTLERLEVGLSVGYSSAEHGGVCNDNVQLCDAFTREKVTLERSFMSILPPALEQAIVSVRNDARLMVKSVLAYVDKFLQETDHMERCLKNPR
nr:hypothetical protein Iba_chr12fCG11790 [Ipomoea batatas]GMD72766.1 hypothetical protein Iba_chr12fCG11810 [Ipomoea batatas]